VFICVSVTVCIVVISIIIICIILISQVFTMPSSRVRKRPRIERFPCAVCSENCESDSIQCDSCKHWVHAACEHVRPQDLSVMSVNVTFMCSACIKAADSERFNYKDSLLRLTEVNVNNFTIPSFNYCVSV
jgi:hypothetical protein